MSTPEDLAGRIAALEVEVARLREVVALAQSDGSAARVLAAGAERDVSEVRAELRSHVLLLNALRQTQLEQGREISELRHEVRDGFATVGAGMSQIVSLLEQSGPDPTKD